MSNLREIFQSCVESTGNNNRAVQQFVLKAKKQNPEVTTPELKEVAGFVVTEVEGEFDSAQAKAEAERKAVVNMDQRWNNNVIKPIKTAIVKAKYPDMTVEEIFGQKATEEAKKIREELKSEYLPRQTRQSSATTTFDHLEGLI